MRLALALTLLVAPLATGCALMDTAHCLRAAQLGDLSSYCEEILGSSPAFNQDLSSGGAGGYPGGGTGGTPE
jgi:hypothetical protein